MGSTKSISEDSNLKNPKREGVRASLRSLLILKFSEVLDSRILDLDLHSELGHVHPAGLLPRKGSLLSKNSSVCSKIQGSLSYLSSKLQEW